MLARRRKPEVARHPGTLEITAYPPPQSGWGVRVQFLKNYLEQRGHRCVVINIGSSRAIPSDQYETVLGGFDYIRKVWRFSRQGLAAHVHVNGASPKGFVLAISAQLINLVSGRRSFLTFHAGVDQVYFPRSKSLALSPVFRLMFALARTIICNSEEVKVKIAEYGVNPIKIAPIPAFSAQYLESSLDPLPADLEAFYQRFSHIVFSYTRVLPAFHPEVLVEGFGHLVATSRGVDAGLVLCGIGDHADGRLRESVQGRMQRLGIASRVFVVDDLSHGAFLHALGRAAIYVRTHVSDGACASIMEALTLRIPVVAAENYTRPPGVVTYPAENAGALARALLDVLDRRNEIVAHLPQPQVRDTVAEEAGLLMA